MTLGCFDGVKLPSIHDQAPKLISGLCAVLSRGAVGQATLTLEPPDLSRREPRGGDHRCPRYSVNMILSLSSLDKVCLGLVGDGKDKDTAESPGLHVVRTGET